jgi:hypothetical protein
MFVTLIPEIHRNRIGQKSDENLAGKRKNQNSTQNSPMFSKGSGPYSGGLRRRMFLTPIA